MAKFITSNNKSAFTKLSPFFDTKNLHYHMSFYIIEIFNTGICEQIFKQKALDISKNMKIY